MSTTEKFNEWYERLKSLVSGSNGAVPGEPKGAELDSCVRQVKNQGHDEQSAYAICNASLKAGLEKDERDELLDTAREMSKYDPQVPLTFGNLVEYAGVDVKGEDELELPKSCRRCNTATRAKGSFMCPDCDPSINKETDEYELVGSGVQEAKGHDKEEAEKAAGDDHAGGSTRKVYLTTSTVDEVPGDAQVKSDDRGLYVEESVDIDQKAEKEDPCWDGYEQRGMKIVDGEKVPNCIPVEDSKSVPEEAVWIDSRSDAPEGANVIEGEQGALYYIPQGGVGGGDDPPESVDLSKETNSVSLEEAGITDGSNHADMRIAQLENGNEAFVKENVSQFEANRALTGEAVYKQVGVPVPDHHYYEEDQTIAKEGVEGQTLRDGVDVDVDEESVREAYAASLITGDTDMHGGNMMIREDGTAVPVDIDSSGGPVREKSDKKHKVSEHLDRLDVDVTYDEVWDRAEEMAKEIDSDALPDGMPGDNVRENVEAIA